jgi:hypothetical protein
MIILLLLLLLYYCKLLFFLEENNQQMHRNCAFLKIYLSIAPTCFGYFPAIIRVLVIRYNVREQCAYFQDTVIYISVLRF